MEQLESRDYLSLTAFDVIGVPAEQCDFSFRGDGVNVAVIDSGADLSQPYYKGAVNIIDPASPASDGFGHGSFIAAEIHQVAPDAGIYAVKVLDDQGVGADSTIEAGIQWVLDHYQQDNISVVNFSIGYFGDDPYIDSRFEQLSKDGVTVCVAAGNSQAQHPNVLSAAANCPDVISVGATWTQFLVNEVFDGATDYQTQTDKIAAYSNRSDKLGILAPGDVHIDGQQKDWTGTSMATGLVSGAAALINQALASVGRTTNEGAVLSIMQRTGHAVSDSATPLDNVEHTGDTFERLNVDAALASIVTPIVGPPTPAPTPTPTPQPPQQSKPQPTDTSFIASVYEHVLNRAPDAQGLSYWLSSGYDHAQIAERIWNSAEHREHYATETAEQLYETLLGRHGDSAGLAYFADKTEELTAEAMLASAEFFDNSA